MTKRVAILTSGGDAPGMNAAIRSVVRCGINKGWQMYGVQHGYRGLISGNINEMTTRDVGGIIQRGGTILGSARCPEFMTVDGRKLAIRNMYQLGIDSLVVIGGNGSQTGNYELHRMGLPVVGIASTIDNDLCGSDITIGVDTALNIALEAIDRLKVTASSHQRAFILEVMGRKCGYIALMSGIAGGAEAITLPEVPTDPEELAQTLQQAYEHGKSHALVVAAEGADYNAAKLTEFFVSNRDRLGFSVRSTILGHVQRGGTPSAYDRNLASRLGLGAVEALERGETGVLVGQIASKITTTPLEDIVGKTKGLDMELVRLAKMLD
ncbi:MAG TPA: 6-phosphofructokinase [Anaerolineaceae bacterium]|jgi:6-phosphofructokinase 1|nr:6-phosphofructokinase [Anaerolineaceae bacterium]NMD27330.1 6-phosphofructokinase [Chloroflexota bacterium]HOA20976.1 6-phosphofructokinase [Anaerolineaceae bacterium]HOG76747.1 6-phosphofructokinase [Anaerolineaceae bacterium]